MLHPKETREPPPLWMLVPFHRNLGILPNKILESKLIKKIGEPPQWLVATLLIFVDAGAQHHSANVVAHGVCADAQVVANLFVDLPLSQQIQYIQFACAKFQLCSPCD